MSFRKNASQTRLKRITNLKKSKNMFEMFDFFLEIMKLKIQKKILEKFKRRDTENVLRGG